MLPEIGSVRPWADPHVVSIGRLDMRVPTVAHPTIDASRSNDPSPWRRSLNGKWAFRRFDNPDDVPASAVAKSATGKHWSTVAVPGNWTLQGVGDLPHYTNVRMPFHGPPPRLPGRNPTGVHRRGVTLPKGWIDRQIIVHIGGAESVHVLYVNGRFVGYGTDSRLASEYDVSRFVQAGANDIAIVVMRWSAHSYLEDQDQWWMAGLHREVYVEARGTVRIDSLACDAGLDGATGTLVASATIGGIVPPGPGWAVRLGVQTLRGRRVAKSQTVAVPHRFAVPYVFTGHTAVARFEVADVARWSAEAPVRYRVTAELIDPAGAVLEAHEQLIGFRSVEVRDRQLLVNGEPIWIFGVNRHDHHPVRGTAVSVDDMREDILVMRRHNITAVRCSHYPNNPRFLDLCDELGMYVVDEANIESHAYNTSLGDDARYRSAWLSRGARMVERDRNHPSVILWSLGNESGYGANHDALAGWIRRTDPSRPLHYEGAVFHDGWVDGGLAASDVVCPMYPTIDAIERYGRAGDGDRPLIMCEYSHAMGNSNGSLADYWDVITTTPGLQGGFIWEWKDHGLLTLLANGKRGFAYGGQFGDLPNDGNFIADGLIASDLTPHPAMQEVVWVHRPVVVSIGADGLDVSNRRSFTDLSDLRADWELMAAGALVASGALDIGDVAPRTSVTVALPCDIPDAEDVLLSVRWAQRRATAWAPKGHLVAWDQIVLRARAGAESHIVPAPGNRLTNEMSPAITGVASTPELCVFRAPVDNDGFKLMPNLRLSSSHNQRALERWQDADVDRLPAEAFVGHEHQARTDTDGSVFHHHIVTVPEGHPDLARVGVVFELSGGFDQLRWHGRGPLENYPDRNSGAMLGVWQASVDRSPYLVPQEFGLRTDCRWFEFIDPSGRTVRLDVLDGDVLHVSATHHTDDDLFGAAHETELRPRRALVVHVDVVHRGLGTASCGPDVLERYRILPGEYRFGYRLSVR